MDASYIECDYYIHVVSECPQYFKKDCYCNIVSLLNLAVINNLFDREIKGWYCQKDKRNGEIYSTIGITDLKIRHKDNIPLNMKMYQFMFSRSDKFDITWTHNDYCPVFLPYNFDMHSNISFEFYVDDKETNEHIILSDCIFTYSIGMVKQYKRYLISDTINPIQIRNTSHFIDIQRNRFISEIIIFNPKTEPNDCIYYMLKYFYSYPGNKIYYKKFAIRYYSCFKYYYLSVKKEGEPEFNDDICLKVVKSLFSNFRAHLKKYKCVMLDLLYSPGHSGYQTTFEHFNQLVNQ